MQANGSSLPSPLHVVVILVPGIGASCILLQVSIAKISHTHIEG